MNYMEMAFSDDTLVDLRRVITGWTLTLSQYKKTLDPEFVKHGTGWGYWDALAALPNDTMQITMRDIVNSHLSEHPVSMTAEVTGQIQGVPLHIGMVPSDTEAGQWFSLMTDIAQSQHYRLCAMCRKPFPFKSAKATFCGPACRTKASRDRTAA